MRACLHAALLCCMPNSCKKRLHVGLQQRFKIKIQDRAIYCTKVLFIHQISLDSTGDDKSTEVAQEFG